MTFSLQRLLVIIGIIVIPFYELIFRIFPYVKVMAPDTRVSKELIAVWFAIAIGLLAIFEGKIKPFNNKYLLAIPLYILFSFWMSPQVDLVINNVQSGDFYFWKPFAQLISFLLMIVAISNIDFEVDTILKYMVWCGLGMSVYMILQSIGIDQFYVVKDTGDAPFTPSNNIGGNLGQPTIVGSFIVMLIPLAFYLKKYFALCVMILACLITHSDMCVLSLIVVGLLYLSKINNYSSIKYFISLFLTLILCFGFCYYKNIYNVKDLVESHSSGRVQVWGQIIGDIKDGPINGNKQDYSFTGVGLGRFSFLFPDKHNSRFLQAHNDFLEFTYNCGIIGLLLLISSFVFIFKRIKINDFNFALIVSFISILFGSLGSFPFQLGAHQFYSAILVGLLHKSGGENVS